MDPVSTPPPDLVTEPSPLVWLAFRVIPALVAVLLIPVFAYYFGFEDALIRPFAMNLGRPAVAIVSGKRISTSRHGAGRYVDLNYQYSKDYAPRPEVKVNAAAYEAIALESHVAMHYLPGCSSCVALDEDYGSAKEQGTKGVVIFLLVVVFTWLQWKFGAKRPADAERS